MSSIAPLGILQPHLHRLVPPSIISSTSTAKLFQSLSRSVEVFLSYNFNMSWLKKRVHSTTTRTEVAAGLDTGANNEL